MDEGDQVMSELHLGCHPHRPSCLSVFSVLTSFPSGNHGKGSASSNFVEELSVGHHSSTEPSLSMDENGDLVIPRRRSSRIYHVETNRNTVSIYHRLKTSVPYVGLQIWRASLLLGDFLVHKMQTTNEMDGVVGLELGAGTGLVGILLATKARRVFLTDLVVDVLDNCYRNVLLNLRNASISMEIVQIRQLDWREPWPPIVTTSEYSWNASDLAELEKVSVILAADVIYNDSITNAFFSLLDKLMPSRSEKVLWLALEKRYNFSISCLDVVAHGYQHFLSFLEVSKSCLGTGEQPGKKFCGKLITLDQIPQYLLEYERTKDLELWEIRRK